MNDFHSPKSLMEALEVINMACCYTEEDRDSKEAMLQLIGRTVRSIQVRVKTQLGPNFDIHWTDDSEKTWKP